MKHYAPAGTPVSLRDIVAGFFARPGDATTYIAKSLQHATPRQSVWLVSSGRAAMTLILRAMRDEVQNSGRDEVIVPAYTCYSVPSAVVRAGLRVRVCDVNPRTLSMDTSALEKCDFRRVLAVVSSNLYGIPNDLARMESICRRRGTYFLDDAAQALGATLGGRPVGGFGDAGLYSFDRGKIISTIQGGAVLCSDDRLSSRIHEGVRGLPRTSLSELFLIGAKMLGYSIFLRPGLYGAIRQLPFLGLGRTEFETHYPIARLSGFQAGIAARIIPHLDSLNDCRRQRAAEYTEAMHDLPGVDLIPVQPEATAVFGRFPFRLQDAELRSQVLDRLNRAGIGASGSYPNSLVDVPEVRSTLPGDDLDCQGAREVAKSVVTLPTHAYCPPYIALKVRKLLKACLP